MRYLLLIMLLLNPLFCETYDDNYLPIHENNETNQSKKILDPFMSGEFSEIIRFDPLLFNDDGLEDSKIEVIINTIQEYIDLKKDIVIKIIGHTNEPTDNYNELVVDSDTYANKIQNWFRPSLSTQRSDDLSQDYAYDISQKIQNADINESLIVVEHRRGDDMAFSDELNEGKYLSNRVMVTLYVNKEIPKDSDGDGVFDKKDNCPDTPTDVKVDIQGCPLDSDKDGVYDYLDDCKETPNGVNVDEKGCPLDEDSDGVADYKDSCLETEIGLEVNTKGCPVGKTLALNFNTNSDEIRKDSLYEIIEFAQFLKKNPNYNVEIIGHTDSIGKESFNMNLSQRRARATKIALMREGILGSRLSSRGKGELEPIQSNRTKEGRAINRRIEVILSVKGEEYE